VIRDPKGRELMAHSHEDLDVWQQGIELVDGVYDLCKQLPADERFGLISQLQRSAVSVPSNVAEGCGRDSTKDLLRHLSIAQGSLAELRTLLEVVRRRQFVSDSLLMSLDAQAKRVGRLLVGLRRALRKKLDGTQVRPNSGH
jgi:four helix bundle protein